MVTEVREMQGPGADPDFGQEDLSSKLSSHQPPNGPRATCTPPPTPAPVAQDKMRLHLAHARTH